MINMNVKGSRMFRILNSAALIACGLFVAIGCVDSTTPSNPESNDQPEPAVIHSENILGRVQQEKEQEKETQPKPTLLNRLKGVVDKAKEVGGGSLDSITESVGSGFQDSSEWSEESLNASMEWAQTYESMKSKGLTTAVNAGSWVFSEYQKGDTWTYKVVQISADAEAGVIEKNMNELGRDGWECFQLHQRTTKFI
ncbi:MAG: hypothetical protein R3C03_21220 [Pirellulaceae bacterium]